MVGHLPFANLTCEMALTIALKNGSVVSKLYILRSAHSPHEILSDIREVVWPWHIRVSEEVLLRIVRIITVTQKELE